MRKKQKKNAANVQKPELVRTSPRKSPQKPAGARVKALLEKTELESAVCVSNFSREFSCFFGTVF